MGKPTPTPTPTYEYPPSEGLQLDERKLPPPVYIQPDRADDNVPFVLYSIEGKEEESKTGKSGKTYCGLKPAIFWTIFTVVLLLVVGGAVGVGVGVSQAGKPKELSQNTTALSQVTSTSTFHTTLSSSRTTSAITSTFSTSTLSPAPTCASTLRLCAFDATCSGRNNPLNQVGKCEDGCSCQSTCGATNNPCTMCAGKNNPSNPKRGTCETGVALGCFCDSVCGAVAGSCTAGGCAGINGFCTAGDFWGCKCVA